MLSQLVSKAAGKIAGKAASKLVGKWAGKLLCLQGSRKSSMQTGG